MNTATVHSGSQRTPTQTEALSVEAQSSSASAPTVESVQPSSSFRRRGRDCIYLQEMVKRLFGPNAIMEGQTSPNLSVSEGAVIHAAKSVSNGGVSIVNDSLKAIPASALKQPVLGRD